MSARKRSPGRPLGSKNGEKTLGTAGPRKNVTLDAQALLNLQNMRKAMSKELGCELTLVQAINRLIAQETRRMVDAAAPRVKFTPRVKL